MKNEVTQTQIIIKELEQEWLTTDQAAKFLCLSTHSILNLCSQGRILYFKQGRRNRYRLDDLKKLLLANPRGDIHGN